MKVYRDPFENLGEDCSPQGETAMTVRSQESVPDEFHRGTEDSRMSREEFSLGRLSLAPPCLAAQERWTGSGAEPRMDYGA